jgi:hypothetical protein
LKGKDKKEEKKELISADEFLKKARPLSLKIAGQDFEAKPQEFSRFVKFLSPLFTFFKVEALDGVYQERSSKWM